MLLLLLRRRRCCCSHVRRHVRRLRDMLSVLSSSMSVLLLLELLLLELLLLELLVLELLVLLLLLMRLRLLLLRLLRDGGSRGVRCSVRCCGLRVSRLRDVKPVIVLVVVLGNLLLRRH